MIARHHGRPAELRAIAPRSAAEAAGSPWTVNTICGALRRGAEPAQQLRLIGMRGESRKLATSARTGT